MLVIRLAHLANMPTPGDIVRNSPVQNRPHRRRLPRNSNRQMRRRTATGNGGGRAWRAGAANAGTARDSAAGRGTRTRA